jgi:hypothetical protein
MQVSCELLVPARRQPHRSAPPGLSGDPPSAVADAAAALAQLSVGAPSCRLAHSHPVQLKFGFACVFVRHCMLEERCGVATGDADLDPAACLATGCVCCRNCTVHQPWLPAHRLREDEPAVPGQRQPAGASLRGGSAAGGGSLQAAEDSTWQQVSARVLLHMLGGPACLLQMWVMLQSCIFHCATPAGQGSMVSKPDRPPFCTGGLETLDEAPSGELHNASPRKSSTDAGTPKPLGAPRQPFIAAEIDAPIDAT